MSSMATQSVKAETREAIIRRYFTFPRTPGIQEFVYTLEDSRHLLGFTAIECLTPHQGVIHLYVFPAFRTSKHLGHITRLFKELLCPLLKKAGMNLLVTSCDTDDKGTANFLRLAGFDVKEMTIASYPLD